ncbi:hypothetical protein [Fusobacterium varium]|uniref:hypothetical protein n=2 Tax=Fusobacterium varium TaxID=856 RepID=UPI0024314BA8|nr:hypothetical protein [Fusobacterium varium]
MIMGGLTHVDGGTKDTYYLWKIVLNNWGVFEKKEVKVRKIVTPQMKEAVIIEAKKKI